MELIRRIAESVSRKEVKDASAAEILSIHNADIWQTHRASTPLASSVASSLPHIGNGSFQMPPAERKSWKIPPVWIKGTLSKWK